ncbi:MAG: hypothetical protein LBH28_04690 [Oscillospiraceae bacterium]|nr:hypothetical protein [Oscillospiraceae bacterium]
MKKYKKLLGGVLALVLLAALMIPLASLTAQAEDYTLTVLNPMGQTAPKNNMPLADREPLRQKLEAKGAQGPVKILLLNYPKNGDELPMWALAIALQERWEEKYPGVTVEVVPTDPAGGPITYGVNPPAWDWNTAGTVPWLGSPWGAKTGFGHIDGMPLSEEPFERYQYWAKNFDFIILGEDN